MTHDKIHKRGIESHYLCKAMKLAKILVYKNASLVNYKKHSVSSLKNHKLIFKEYILVMIDVYMLPAYLCKLKRTG